MAASPAHKITRIKKYSSGAEEWFCPTCGRRFVIQWTPEYQCVVLEVGDEAALHNTGKGAMVAVQPRQEDPWLGPWQEWIEKCDFENLWCE